MGGSPSAQHVVLCKVRLVGAWIKRRKLVVGARRIRSEKLREHQYRKGYAWSLEGKIVEWDGDNNIEHIWDLVKRALVKVQEKIWRRRTIELIGKLCGRY